MRLGITLIGVSVALAVLGWTAGRYLVLTAPSGETRLSCWLEITMTRESIAVCSY